jgi:PAS domain S-box-containing protein
MDVPAPAAAAGRPPQAPPGSAGRTPPGAPAPDPAIAADRLRLLVDLSPALIYNLVLEPPYGRRVSWIGGDLVRLLGYRPEEALAPEWWNAGLHRDDQVTVYAATRELLRRGESACEYRFRNKDGHYRWMRDESRLLPRSPGRPAELVGSWSDVTELKLTDIALQENQERFRQLADNVDEVFYILDLRSPQVIYVSLAYERLWGVSAASLYERPRSWLSAVHPDDRQRVKDLASRERNISWNLEYRIQRADGSELWIADRGFPVRDGEGVPYRVAGLARDITQRKQSEALMLRAKEEAEKANLGKSAFIANMSHELVTPLNSVIGFSELLADGGAGDLTARQAQYVGHIVTSGRHLLALVNEVLDLARLEAGRLQIEPQEVDLGAMLREIVESLSAAARDRGITLVAATDAGLPPIEADPVRVRQVVLGLLDNGLKFTPRGGRVTVSAVAWDGEPLASGPAVRVTVADTGIGVEPGDRERLFQPFEQLDAGYDRRRQGSGLGLALARRLIELHGGRIWLESAGPGLGTTLSFLVPVWRGAAPPAPVGVHPGAR